MNTVDSEVLATKWARNVHELRNALDAMIGGHNSQYDTETVYTFGKYGENLRIRLIEDTLTDGSKVLNINIE